MRRSLLCAKKQATLSVNNGLFLLVLVTWLGACQTVKPYQRAYLNDAEMQPGANRLRQSEANAHAYREGAAGGGAGKSGGGCGCN